MLFPTRCDQFVFVVLDPKNGQVVKFSQGCDIMTRISTQVNMSVVHSRATFEPSLERSSLGECVVAVCHHSVNVAFDNMNTSACGNC